MVHLVAHSPRMPLSVRLGLHFVRPNTDLMTQILDLTHFNKVNRCRYDSDMEAFLLPDTVFNACRRLKATVRQMQYIFIRK